ncbi:hypothetical protein [Streptomyces olivaceus]|uniref:hypothetical protein n=1 Tax=Streptomyces olivaceus TaxID=47716 RepID=UPI001CCDC9F5|nr:hypothetical protein [Streptomyces olivaceus]MBZ6142462.1 hypothetical protein [Streptomyces olivaceus]MBZ6170169.1 hypothetical protein [Streptomyces olivaceus]
MSFHENKTTISADEIRVIFERLTPYLPSYLRKVENHPCGYRLRFEFAPFTGCEEEPSVPGAVFEDPQLAYVWESENADEHRLRRAARTIISDLYEDARKAWRDAAHVAALRKVVLDAPELWQTYEQEAAALESAYAHLRTPEAAREWPAAVSRLVDAQDRTRTAAEEFQCRAVDIADVHDKFVHSDLSHARALSEAGYPGGKDWYVGFSFGGYFRDGLVEQVDRRIKEQNDHVTRVGRLAGLHT